MSLKASKALRNEMLKQGGFRQIMSGCVLKVYTGAQPSTAEAAPTGTLLATFSDAGGAITREVRATGTVDLTGGASGSVDQVEVGGINLLGAAVPFNTSLTQTAADVVTAINKFHDYKVVTASSSGTLITLTANRGYGAAINGVTVVTTVTTITKTDVNMGSAVAGVTEVNGLNWETVATGIISKDTLETWQSTPVATGTAGWFRFEASVLDSGVLDSAEAFPRLDGAIATTGAEMNLGNTTFTVGVIQVVTSFQLTFPTL